MVNRYIGVGFNWKEEWRFVFGICVLFEVEEIYGGFMWCGKEEGVRDGLYFRIFL